MVSHVSDTPRREVLRIKFIWSRFFNKLRAFECKIENIDFSLKELTSSLISSSTIYLLVGRRVIALGQFIIKKMILPELRCNEANFWLKTRMIISHSFYKTHYDYLSIRQPRVRVGYYFTSASLCFLNNNNNNKNSIQYQI